jgi:hypothetical protein
VSDITSSKVDVFAASCDIIVSSVSTCPSLRLFDYRPPRGRRRSFPDTNHSAEYIEERHTLPTHKGYRRVADNKQLARHCDATLISDDFRSCLKRRATS